MPPPNTTWFDKLAVLRAVVLYENFATNKKWKTPVGNGDPVDIESTMYKYYLWVC